MDCYTCVGIRLFILQDYVSVPTTHFDTALLSFVVEALFIWFWGLLTEKIILYVAINFLCSWEEVNLGSSYATILNLIPMTLLLIYS